MFSWFKKRLSSHNKETVPQSPPANDAAMALGALLEQADTLFKAGKLEDAARSYRAALEQYPQDALAHNKLGDVFYEQQSLAKAESCYRRAVELQPDYSEALLNLGLVLDQQGQFQEAETVYRHAIQCKPDEALAHFNLSVTLKSLGHLQEAEASCRTALGLRPDFSHARFHLAGILTEQGRFAEAESSYQKTIVDTPDFIPAYYALVRLFQQQNKLSATLPFLQKLLELQPELVEARNALLTILLTLKRFPEAETVCRGSIALAPDDAQHYYNLGITQREQNLQQQAVDSFEHALQLNPGLADAHLNLALSLISLRRYSEAESCLRGLLQIRPGDAVVYDNLGMISYLQERFAEAIANFQRAIEISPDFINAHNNLASTYTRMGRLQEAETQYRLGLKLQPENHQIMNNLGLVLVEQGRVADAVAFIRKAWQLAPEIAETYDNLLFALNYHPDLSGTEIYAAYQDYDRHFALPHYLGWHAFSNDKNISRRLKIGYVSPDFFEHSVRHFLEPLLAHHDKHAVEVYAYAHVRWEDAVTNRYKSYIDHWIPITLMSDDEVAQRIRADGIDILVDLSGHTRDNRLPVFTRKPAPVSLSWLGFAYTTGIKAIDYLMTDEISAPVGCEALFAEQPWRLPAPSLAYRPSEGMGEVSSLPALTNQHIRFGTLSRAIRLNERVIRVWADILKQVDNAKLVIDSKNFTEPSMQQTYLEKFAAHGIDQTRLEIGYHSPPWDVMRNIDIGLDCFPHNSGTTLFETLYMGIPYVTLADRPSMGLLGSSILSGLGHPEWIARTEEEYIEKAVALASDLPGLSRLRAGLREEMKAGPLMDEAGFARKVETAYRSMWVKWCGQNNT